MITEEKVLQPEWIFLDFFRSLLGQITLKLEIIPFFLALLSIVAGERFERWVTFRTQKVSKLMLL